AISPLSLHDALPIFGHSTFFGREHDVARLEIAMNKAALLRRTKRRDHLLGYSQNRLGINRPGAPNPLVQRFAFHQFHGVKILARSEERRVGKESKYR